MKIDILKRQKRRSISLHITENGELEVRAPRLVPLFFIQQFVNANSGWIDTTRGALQRLPKRVKHEYQEGERFRLGGKEYMLHKTHGNSIVLTDTQIFFPIRFLVKPRYHMEQFCRRYAKQFLKKRLDVYAQKMGVSYKKITIRDTSTRWGSCSSTGTISFCYRLVLADLPIIDYVVIHELSHITHPHHKQAFWERVSQFCPDYTVLRTWLRKSGHTLQT